MRCDAVTRACCIFDAEKQRLHSILYRCCEKAALLAALKAAPAALYAAEHGPAAGRTANEQKRQDRPHGTGRTDQKGAPKMTDAILQQLAAAYGTPTFVFNAMPCRRVCALYRRYSARTLSSAIPSRLIHFCCPPCPPSLRGWRYAAPASCPYARACRQRMRVSSIPASTKHLPTLPVPSQTVPEATPQNPFAGPLSAGGCPRGGPPSACAAAAERRQSVRHVEAGSFYALKNRAETPDLDFIGIHYFVGTQRKS